MKLSPKLSVSLLTVLIEKDIQIEKHFREELDLIRGDKHLLEQVVLNLALNANRGYARWRGIDFHDWKIEFDTLLGKNGSFRSGKGYRNRNPQHRPRSDFRSVLYHENYREGDGTWTLGI